MPEFVVWLGAHIFPISADLSSRVLLITFNQDLTFSNEGEKQSAVLAGSLSECHITWLTRRGSNYSIVMFPLLSRQQPQVFSLADEPNWIPSADSINDRKTECEIVDKIFVHLLSMP